MLYIPRQKYLRPLVCNYFQIRQTIFLDTFPHPTKVLSCHLHIYIISYLQLRILSGKGKEIIFHFQFLHQRKGFCLGGKLHKMEMNEFTAWLYCTWLYCTWLYCTIVHGCIGHGCTVHGFTVHSCTVQGCILHGCTVHGCTVLYMVVLYIVVLYCTWLYIQAGSICITKGGENQWPGGAYV